MKTMLDVVGAVKTYTDSKVSLDPKEITVDYSDIISITDAFPKAAKDVKLKVDAVQDLHGYDNPWVGGAGKNKLPVNLVTLKGHNTSGTWNSNSYTYGNTTFTFEDIHNTITVTTGSNGASSTFVFWIRLAPTDDYSSGNWIVSGCPSGGGNNKYALRIYKNGNTYADDLGSGANFAGTTELQIGIVIFSGQSLSNAVFKPMIRSSSVSDPTYEPYENICPITGHSEAKATRVGHNLINVTATSQTINGVTFIVNNNGTVTVSTDSGGATAGTSLQLFPTFSNNSISIENGDYILSGCPSQSGQNLAIFGDDRSSDGSTTINGIADYGNEANISITQGRFRAYIFITSGTVITTPVTFKPMLRLVTDTNTTYEPYNGEIYTIDLDGTRYGGTLDVTSGVLTVLGEMKNANTLSWSLTAYNAVYTSGLSNIAKKPERTPVLCNIVPYKDVTNGNGEDNIVFWGGSDTESNGNLGLKCTAIFTTVSEWNTYIANNDVYLLYELATPQTIQLTAEEIQLLQGYNTLFADTGDISLTYNPATYGNVVEEVGELEDDVQALTNEVRGNWATGGVNLFDGKFTVGYNISNEGDIVTNSKCAYTTDFMVVTGNKVTVSFKKAVYSVYISEYGSSDNFIRRDASSANVATFTATLSDNCKKIRVAFNYDDGTTVTNEIANSINTQVELGDSATPYQPYAKTNAELTDDLSDLDTFARNNLDVQTKTATISGGTATFTNIPSSYTKRLDFYTSVPGLDYTSISVSGTTVTLTYGTQYNGQTAYCVISPLIYLV